MEERKEKHTRQKKKRREKERQRQRGEKKKEKGERGEKRIKRESKMSIRRSVDSNKPFWRFSERENKKLNQQSEF